MRWNIHNIDLNGYIYLLPGKWICSVNNRSFGKENCKLFEKRLTKLTLIFETGKKEENEI